MFFKNYSLYFFFKKLIALNLSICFMLIGISPVFGAWDDYERGRAAFDEGNYKAAFAALRSVYYVQAIPYLEVIHQERKSRGKADLTKNDLSSEEFAALEEQLKELKESPKYLGKEDKDLEASLVYRKYLKDVQKSLKKKQKPVILPLCIRNFVYGNYLYATWIESKDGLSQLAISNYSHALNCGELSAFQRFQRMNERERTLFSNRDRYEEELRYLNLEEEGVFERMYTLSALYKERAENASVEDDVSFYMERYQIWLKRAAKRGNVLRAQQEMLNISADELYGSFIAEDVSVTEFPQFPELLDALLAQSAQFPSSQSFSASTSEPSAPPLPSEEEQNSFKARMSLAAYAVDNGDGLAALCMGQNYEMGEIGGHPSHEKALFWYNKSVQLGYIKAFIALGKIHEARGTSGEKSLARECYRKAAEGGDALGMFNAAIIALQASDISEAQHWFEESNRMRFTYSYVKLAQLYTNYPGFENFERAAQLVREFFASSSYVQDLATPDLRKSANVALAVLIHNNCYSKKEEEDIFKFARFFRFEKALFSLGAHYLSEINELSDMPQKELLRKKALSAFLMGAQGGNSYAKLQLGELTEFWRPEPREDAVKIGQFLMDLTTDEDPYTRIVGHLFHAQGYLKGAGIFEKDRAKSILHYESVLRLHEQFPGIMTDEGIYSCFLNLGYLLLSEEEILGSAPDYERAFQLTQQATDLLSPNGAPHAQAYYNLSQFFRQGLGRAESLRDTFRYLSIAAGEGKLVFPEMGDPDAHHDLGLMYLMGNDYARQDIDKAEVLFQKAASEGITRAYLSLGSLYVGGVAEKRNILKAIEVFDKGVKAGDMKCTLILAFINLVGEKDILERNVEKAMDYIALARESGLTVEDVEKSLQSFEKQSVVRGILQASALKSSTESKPQTKTDRLIEELRSTEITAATKWKSVERLLSTLVQLQGGNLKPGGGGSVRHFQVGEKESSMHEVHQPGKGGGIGHGRAQSLKALVQAAQAELQPSADTSE